MAMPRRPGAHLVVIETDLPLGRFKAGFDSPPGSRDPHQSAQRGAVGSKRQVIGQLVRFSDRATDQQTPAPSRPQGRVCLIDPIVETRSLGTLAGAQALPVAS